MIRICELMGLTRADLTEITSYIMGIHIVGVLAGNVFFLAWKELLRLCEKLIDSAVSWIFRRIRNRPED